MTVWACTSERNRTQFSPPMRNHWSFPLGALETLRSWMWKQANKQTRTKPKHLSKSIRFIHCNLVWEDIHWEQHTCQSKSWKPGEWPLGPGICVISRPLFSKLVSVKVTVCGNENRLGWWLLSVKTAHTASVARHKAKLRARHGRRGWEPVWRCGGIQGLETCNQGLLDSMDVFLKPGLRSIASHKLLGQLGWGRY